MRYTRHSEGGFPSSDSVYSKKRNNGTTGNETAGARHSPWNDLSNVKFVFLCVVRWLSAQTVLSG